MVRTPAERHDLLVQAIERDAGVKMELDALGRRTLGVFEAILQARHRYGQDAIGYYVVSGTQGADDVLAPLLLARWAEAYDRVSGEVAVDIAPLFESVDALEHCGDVMKTLLGDPLYRRHLDARGRTQCALIGYSDTNKESGICSCAFRRVSRAGRSLDRAGRGQRAPRHLPRARRQHRARRFAHRFSGAHGAGRHGEWRAAPHRAGRGHQPGLWPASPSRCARWSARSMRSRCRSAARRPAARRSAEQVQFAARLATVSRQDYRRFVHADAEFYAWFQAVTPIDVIARMQIGSRPAVRPGKEGFDALRAVPWVFAWTQSRHMLPAWFGAGAGPAHRGRGTGPRASRAPPTAEWNFFTTLIDDLEASLARADLDIAAAYEELAREPPAAFRRQTTRGIQPGRASRCWPSSRPSALLDRDPTMQRSIELRNPYVDPINLLQVDLLRRWRESGRQDRDLFESLLACIAGIAEGLQSTG